MASDRCVRSVAEKNVFISRKWEWKKIHLYETKDGKITREEAFYHPKKNMLMRALGCNAFVEPDVSVKGFLRDDIFLMASDGLTNMVKQEDIFKIAKGNIEKAPIRLVDLANENGGLDNITVVVLKNI